MARKPKQSKAATPPKTEAVVTMKALEELSDEEEEDELPSESEWDDKTKALKNVIESGRFDQALKLAKDNDEDDDEFEEATLDDEEDDSEEAARPHKTEQTNDGSSEEESEDEEDDNESEEEEDNADPPTEQKMKGEAVKDAHTSNNDTPVRPSPHQRNSYNAKALRSLNEELAAKTKAWPWAETFDITSQEALPFGTNEISIHDDLKREVTFYDVALKAVLQAKNNCKDAKIPFSRPDDFFAEMVKSDEHMARIKDRLIFDTKKMDAVSQRKSNKEQKLRAKESKATKLAEKAKRKKDHFKAVEEWAETAKANRGQSLDDRENMDSFFSKGNNKKREYADKKYGHGGRRGRFKQTDPKSLNDMSAYNPKGNFAGGMKSAGKRKNGAGANRPGKRSRDAKRSGQR